MEQKNSRLHPLPDHVEAHILCDSCTQLITGSRLIQEFMGTAEPEDAYTIWKRLKGKARTEVFSCTHAISSLADHARAATCHLCSISWHTLQHDALKHGGYLTAVVVDDRKEDHVAVTFQVVSNATAEGSGTRSPERQLRDVPIKLKRYRGNAGPHLDGFLAQSSLA